MNRNLKIIIAIIATIILILIIINIYKDTSSNSEKIQEENIILDIKYDENTGEYYIEDAETGEILHTAYRKDELYIYTIDPDYDPKNPDAVSDEYYEEELKEN